MKKLIKLIVILFLLSSCSNIDAIDQQKDTNKTSDQSEDFKEEDINPSVLDDQAEKPVDNKKTDLDKDEKTVEKDKIKIDETKSPSKDNKAKDPQVAEKDSTKESDDKNVQKPEVNVEKKPLEEKNVENKGNSDTEQVVEKENQVKPITGDQKSTNTEETADSNQDKVNEDNNKKPLVNDEKTVLEQGQKGTEEVKAPVQNLLPYSIYYDGASVGYLDIGIDNYNIDVTQRYIDDGNVISTVTRFSPNDNEITYFSGHTYNYNNVARLGVNSVVTVTDANGVGYNYKIIDFKKYPAGQVAEGAPFIGGYHLIDLAGEGINKESIAIQYCDENNVPTIFFGLPN